MFKKAAITAGTFAFSAVAGVTMALAQTSTPVDPSPTTRVSPTMQVTTTPAPSVRVPEGAPATGMGN